MASNILEGEPASCATSSDTRVSPDSSIQLMPVNLTNFGFDQEAHTVIRKNVYDKFKPSGIFRPSQEDAEDLRRNILGGPEGRRGLLIESSGFTLSLTPAAVDAFIQNQTSSNKTLQGEFSPKNFGVLNVLRLSRG
ncbi:hypothetical protein PABG_06539 [Paracoccidioides brasiliensis Pb03]|nr:hypothetical protein PABG_06539 [Paracoccidioides brasiliensis Pb03]